MPFVNHFHFETGSRTQLSAFRRWQASYLSSSFVLVLLKTEFYFCDFTAREKFTKVSTAIA